MRSYVRIYDASAGASRVAFRDDDDPLDTYYVMGGVPPITERGRAEQIVAALNIAARQGVTEP